MSRPEPTTHAEMHARYVESRRRLGLGAPVETPRVRLAPLFRPEPAEEPSVARDDLRPAEIEALADALMRRMRKDDDVVAGIPRPIMLSDVIRAVAHRAGLRSSDLRSERRTAEVSQARQRAMWLAKRMTLRSLPAIGRAFGDRDHTTIMHGIRKVEARLENDPELRAELASIEAELRVRFGPSLRHPDGLPGTGAAS